MKPYSAEVHQLSDELAVCQTFDAKMKADLFASLVQTSAGSFLIDPFAVDDETISEFTHGRVIAGIIVTNENHVRASDYFSRSFSAPVYAHADAAVPGSRDIFALSDDLQIVQIAGAAKGEVALFLRMDGGTVVIGDALINFGSHGFSLLPSKYCADIKLMRQSLTQLVELRFERLLFAHGAPILSGARDRLAALLETET